MAFIIGSAFKIASSVGVAGVSVVSVPVTISVVGSSKTKGLFDPLKKEVENIKALVTNSVGGLDSALEDEYSKFGNKVKSDYEEYLSKNTETLKAIGPIAQTAQELLKAYGEDINYYAFELGAIVREVLKTVPTILKDSALDAKSEGKAQNLLSLQKIMMMAKSGKISNLVVGVMAAMEKYPSLTSELSSKDVQGVIQIFRELPKGEIDSFLEGVGTNATSLEDKSKYCSPAKLMLHLLLGKNKIEGITDSIKQLEKLLEELKDSISSQIKDIGEEAIASLKEQLKEISDKQTIKDPCAQDTK